MSGSLPGVYFKLVIGNLLSAQLMFPEYKQRIDSMEPQKAYPWDEYTKMMRDIAAKLPPTTIVLIGKKIVRESKGHFMSQGFGSAESILKDWGKLFSANIEGAPENDKVTTTEFAPGSVILKAGAAQPAKLVEGYMRGVVEMFGGQVSLFETKTLPEYAILKMRWT
jgi:hypothetical protein